MSIYYRIMSRKRTLVFFLLFLSLGVYAVKDNGDNEQRKDRPNVLFIATDDLRYDLGCLGNQVVKSPNLDKLSSNAVIFERAYCQQALCAPSRASLLTGMRPDSLKFWNLTGDIREHKFVKTLPEILKKEGYFTQDIGKIFHNWHHDGHVDYPESWSTKPIYHFGTHGNDTLRISGEIPPSYTLTQWCECRDVPDTAYYDGRIAVESVKVIEEFAEKPDQPFFLAVGFWKPHIPFNAPKKYWDMYQREDIPEIAFNRAPVDVPPIALHDSWEFFRGKSYDLSPAQIMELRHGYYACISYVDAQIGIVLDALKKNGLDKNTIVIFWSDHGFHLGEHTLWAKTSNFELDARVPLIISIPGNKNNGQHSRSIVELLDIYPTVLDLCDVSIPNNIQGKSLKPVLEDLSLEIKEGAFTQHPRPSYYKEKPEVMGHSVRTKKWRYTEWRSWESGEIVGKELYDHENDSLETVNIAKDEKYIDVVRKLSMLIKNN
ncbi:sulfatase [Sunxiuqinia sp. A32]|uniref:sulfatase n=1 Tax=Sunxiuqinia sp. A32 TaxID=3461496 RepID=UPI004045C388